MSDTSVTVASICDSWAQQSEVRASLCVDMGECKVRVSSDNPALVQALNDYFGDFVDKSEAKADLEIFAWESPTIEDPAGLGAFADQPREGGKSGLKEAFVRVADGVVIRKVRTGMLYAVSEERHQVKGECLKNLPQVVNFANNRAIQFALRGGDLLGHASALVAQTQGGEKGIAFAGFSGMGKSTLALHLMSAANYRFVSNDRIMFRQQAGKTRMLGVAKHPRINPGTILNNSALHAVSTEKDRERWKSMPIDELWELEEKYDGMVEQCFGPGRFSLRAPLDAFVVLNWKRNGEAPQLQQVDLSQRLELLDAIRKSPGLFYSPAPGASPYDGSVENYLKVLSQVKIYELSGGVDFEKAVQMVRSTIAEPK